MLGRVFLLLALQPAPPTVVIDERERMREEAPPHGAIGMSTAYRLSDGVPQRTMELRRRVLMPARRSACIRSTMTGSITC